MTFADACLATLAGSRIRCAGWMPGLSLSWHHVHGWRFHCHDAAPIAETIHPSPLDIRRLDWEVVE